MLVSTASVWPYCRVADVMTWLPRALILVPLHHFVDDFGSCETSDTAESAFQSRQDICRNLDVKCQEKQPPAWSHVMQGVVFELGGGVLDDKFKPTEAATIAGKLSCTSLRSLCSGRPVQHQSALSTSMQLLIGHTEIRRSGS